MGSARLDVLVIGSGPAGLAAAETAALAGARVLVAEKMPSFGRKFLMAGRSGLNLTKDEPDDHFRARIETDIPAVRSALEKFGPREVIAWAEGLDQPVFTGSSGRVFPKAMKASPLLRAWIARLSGLGVVFETRRQWEGWQDRLPVLCGAAVPVAATVLAMGGASWARLGSDGAWVAGLKCDRTPFSPSNMGFDVNWSAHMARHFGTPLKQVRLSSGSASVLGECVVSANGLEGSAVYTLSRPILAALSAGAETPLTIDLLPDLSPEQIAGRLARPRGKASLSNHLRKALRMPGVKTAILREAGPLPEDPADLAHLIKTLPVAVTGPRPIDEAISVAGGIAVSALTGALMLRAHPGVFVAGEMLDWDARTGGYLITTCMATGRWAGQAAAAYALDGKSEPELSLVPPLRGWHSGSAKRQEEPTGRL